MRAAAIGYVDVGRGKVAARAALRAEDLEDFKHRAQGAAMAVYKRGEIYHYEFEYRGLDFAALRAARASAKPKSSSAPSGKRRRRKPNVVKLSDGGR